MFNTALPGYALACSIIRPLDHSASDAAIILSESARTLAAAVVTHVEATNASVRRDLSAFFDGPCDHIVNRLEEAREQTTSPFAHDIFQGALALDPTDLAAVIRTIKNAVTGVERPIIGKVFSAFFASKDAEPNRLRQIA
jgi:hypothetical protein